MRDPGGVSRRDLFRARLARPPRLSAALAGDLVATAGVEPWQRVLEAGAGDGAVARSAAQRGAFAVVCGTDRAAVVRARGRAVLEARVAPLDDLPFPDAEFHAVISPFAAWPAPVLAELVRVLRPRGTLVLGHDEPDPPPGLDALLDGIVTTPRERHHVTTGRRRGG